MATPISILEDNVPEEHSWDNLPGYHSSKKEWVVLDPTADLIVLLGERSAEGTVGISVPSQRE